MKNLYTFSFFNIITPAISFICLFIYFSLFIFIKNERKKINKKLKITKRKSKIKFDIFIQAFTNVLVWLPLSTIAILSLSFKLNFSRVFYTSIMTFFLPINSVVNPLIFILSKCQDELRRKTKVKNIEIEEKILNLRNKGHFIFVNHIIIRLF